MIGEKIQDAFNKQMKEEVASAYLYLAMAAWFNTKGLGGMAHWMRVQFREEMEHAMKFFDHVIERNGRAELMALDKPKREWTSALDAFAAAYKHEQYITAKIAALVKLAKSEEDREAEVFLNWFVTEQEEEEAQTLEIVEKLKRIGDSADGLAMLDRELGKRSS